VVERFDGACVVGAGPHGLIAARALKRAGVPYMLIERNGDVGGLWDIDSPGSPMYESCHYISSRNGSAYFDFPMPADYADYPSRKQIHTYVKSFADAYDLRGAIEFRSQVIRAEPDAKRWLVRTSDSRVRSFDALIAAPGTNWIPRTPTFDGGFSGMMMHSVSYRNPDFLRGKRVLIVGLGNSGADIACDAARVADKVFVSVRRGYHFFPKHFFGIPTLDYFENPALAPAAAREMDVPTALSLLVGDATRYGFPRPDHKPGESHPLLNTQILYYASHGRIFGKGDVSRMDGKTVHFRDGSKEQIDVVICATGYQYRVPFVDEEALGWVGGHPRLYMSAFSRQHPTFFAYGLMEAGAAPWKIDDQLAYLIAEYISDIRSGAKRGVAMRRRVETEVIDLQEGSIYVKSSRTENYVNVPTFERHLHRVVADAGYTRLVPGFYDVLKTARKAPTTREQA
jgi:hypothetical protein